MCNVTAFAPENYIIINLRYAHPLTMGIDKTRIILESPLITLIDSENLCSTVQSERLTIIGCDFRTPGELTLSHYDANKIRINITLQDFNFRPEGQLFPVGSVMVNADDGSWGDDFKCDAFSSPSYTLSNTLYIYIM